LPSKLSCIPTCCKGFIGEKWLLCPNRKVIPLTFVVG
jgi:hypothetical protein